MKRGFRSRFWSGLDVQALLEAVGTLGFPLLIPFVSNRVSGKEPNRIVLRFDLVCSSFYFMFIFFNENPLTKKNMLSFKLGRKNPTN